MTSQAACTHKFACVPLDTLHCSPCIAFHPVRSLPRECPCPTLATPPCIAFPSHPRPPQVRQYDTVIALSEEGAALGTRDIRSSSRDTLKHFEQDMALATALAQVGGRQGVAGERAGKGGCARIEAAGSECEHLRRGTLSRAPRTCARCATCAPHPPRPQCGLADRALKSGQAALAWARLGEALDLLTDASGPAAAGGRSAVLPGRGTGGEASTNGRAALAPRLQADIRAALAEHHPEAVADYLQVGRGCSVLRCAVLGLAVCCIV